MSAFSAGGHGAGAHGGGGAEPPPADSGAKAAAAGCGAGSAAGGQRGGRTSQGTAAGKYISTAAAIAADWAGELLRLRQQPPGGARVLVTANALSGEVVRTVTELALRHRYLLLTVPFGGEELCRRLRREYGVSVLLNPTAEQMAEAAVQIAFDPVEAASGGFLPLYDEQLPLPALLLPPSIEACLPKGVNRGQLLSVLWEHGALRPGQVTVRLEANRAE